MAKSSVTILAYHRVDRPGTSDLSPDLIDAYPDDFEAQMRFVAGHYSVISSHDLARALRGSFTLPKRALIITFDDGYCSFESTAWPILKRLGLPVTLFVPTDYATHPSGRFWWDDLYRGLEHTTHRKIDMPGMGMLPLGSAAERLAAYNHLVRRIERMDDAAARRRVDRILELCEIAPDSSSYLLGWEQVEALASEGLDVGPHTRHHVILSRVEPARVQAEVSGSWADLQAHLPHPVPIFCYPNGQPHAISPEAIEAVKRAGLVGGCTMVAGLNIVGRTDPYRLYRVGAVAGESLGRFRLKITAAGRIYRRLKALALYGHTSHTSGIQGLGI